MPVKGFTSIRARLYAGALVLFLLTTVTVAAVTAQTTRAALTTEIEHRHAAEAALEAQRVEAVAERLRDQGASVARSVAVKEAFTDAPRDQVAAAIEARIASTLGFDLALVFDREGNYLAGAPAALDEGFRNVTDDPGFTTMFLPAHSEAIRRDEGILRAGLYQGTWNLVTPIHLTPGLQDASGASSQGAGENRSGDDRADTGLDGTGHARANGTVLFIGPSLAVILERALPDASATGLLTGPDDGADADPGRNVADHAYVITADGIVQAGTGDRSVGEPLVDDGRAWDQPTGRAATLPLGGQPHLVSSFPIADTPWIVVTVTPEERAFAPIEALLNDIAIVAAIALGLVIIATESASRVLLAPVGRLRTATQRIMAGEAGHQVRVDTRDEFQQLATAFNHMSATLQQQHAQLARSNEELESIVDERTRRLVQMNREIQDLAYAVSHDLKTPLVTMGWIIDELRDTIDRYLARPDEARGDGSPATPIKGPSDGPSASPVGDGPRHLENDPELPEWIDRLDASVERMERLISDFLDYERSGKGTMTPEVIDLAAFLEDLQEEFRGTIAKRAATIQHGQLPQALVMDRGHLHAMAGNLLGNALKYGRNEGGHIRIEVVPVTGLDASDAGRVEVHPAPGGPAGGRASTTVAPPTQPARPTNVPGPEEGLVDDGEAVRTAPEREELEWDASGLAPTAPADEAPYWRFEVHDDGPGVVDGDKERIFGIFVRGHDKLGREQPGTGVGLALVRKLARTYDGDAGVADSPLGGALVWFALPARLVHVHLGVGDPASVSPAPTVSPPAVRGALEHAAPAQDDQGTPTTDGPA